MLPIKPFSYDLKADWDGITVEYTRSDIIGEYDVSFPKHIIGVALAPQDRVTWRLDSGASSQTTPLAQLAAVAQFSQFHFARAFKAATGQPPHRYVRQQRIERAKILLSVTRLSVSEE